MILILLNIVPWNTQTCSTALNTSGMARFRQAECFTVLNLTLCSSSLLLFSDQISWFQVLFRNSYCAQCEWPRWTPASPDALPFVCLSRELPHGWPSPRCRSPSQLYWWSETARRHAFHSDAPQSLREPCSFLRKKKNVYIQQSGHQSSRISIA